MNVINQLFFATFVFNNFVVVIITITLTTNDNNDNMQVESVYL